MPKRYLAIDYGQKKTGLAISDTGGLMAFPYDIWLTQPFSNFFLKLQRLIKKENIDTLVVGLALDRQGSLTQQNKTTLAFINKLKTLGVPIVTVNERGSSLAATEKLETFNLSGPDDAVAAQIILQTYLDQHAQNKD